jgi:transcriptional regulator with XRE-family HTH domain
MMSETVWMQTFGNNLIYFMQQAGMTQEQLARATGLTQASISRYAAGLQLPGIRAVINIANVLGVTTDELIDFGDMIEQ